MSTIGERLREERERLKLSQTVLGESCGVQKRAQINYEKGERAPDALYLAAFHAAGGDMMYVLTGQRGAVPLAPALPPDESELLRHYRASPPELRRAALRVLLGGSASPGQTKQKFNGPVGQSITGNVVNQGDVNVGGSPQAGISRKRGAGRGG